MRIKRILAVILAAVFLNGCGCSDRVELFREAVDSRFTPEHTSSITTWQKIGDISLPHRYKFHHDDTWEIQYRITYDDGTVKLKWVTVSEEEYDAFNERKDGRSDESSDEGCHAGRGTYPD